jgi:hypothetical protein
MITAELTRSLLDGTLARSSVSARRLFFLEI